MLKLISDLSASSWHNFQGKVNKINAEIWFLYLESLQISLPWEWSHDDAEMSAINFNIL